MTDKRFNQLLAGPLHHPLPILTVSRLTQAMQTVCLQTVTDDKRATMQLSINRLAIALRAIVDAMGEDGDAALEEYCSNRQARDKAEEAGQEIP